MSWNIYEAVSYYSQQGAPKDQSALISLLREIQREYGGSIPSYALTLTAGAYDIQESYLRAIIRRIPSLRETDVHCLELCAGPNCGKHTALADLAKQLTEVAPGKITVKHVPCMRLCGKGPNIRWDGRMYHRADEALLRKLLHILDP